MFHQAVKNEASITSITTDGSLLSILKNDAASLFKLDYESFIKVIQNAIPESLYLKSKANTSAEGLATAKSVKNVFGLTEDEEIRAFSGLLRFKDVMHGTQADYNNFVACQIEMKKPVLSFDSFNKIRQYIQNTLTTPEDTAAAMWSILCNDLGKVHSVIDEYEKLPNKKHLGHDLLLSELLRLKPELFPGFVALPLAQRKQIIEGYASGCDISQLEQLELPATSVTALKSMDKKTLDLYIVHTIFDVSGAAAHFKPNGSLTLHEETWAFFNATRIALEKLHNMENNSVEEAYQHYLQFRGQCVGIQNDSAENIALIRIAGLSRLATHEQGQMLLKVWNNLDAHSKAVLINELNIHGGKGMRAIFVGYGVAMLINPQSALIKELNDMTKKLNLSAKPEQTLSATMEGLRIGLINLAAAFGHARALIRHDAKAEIFVAECDEIAKLLSKEPRKTIEMDWSIVCSSERRPDFKLVDRPLKQYEASNSSSSNTNIAAQSDALSSTPPPKSDSSKNEALTATLSYKL